MALPTPDNPKIDKFAILLRPVPENPEPYINAQGKPKMVGLVGTNRMSDHGLETGYCMNIKYWGRGYAGEAFAAFLKYYWTLSCKRTTPLSFATLLHFPLLTLFSRQDGVPETGRKSRSR